MHRTVVVVGAGHSGLAMSAELSRRGTDHVLLERGDVAHAWRTQRWDSLRLLTPNWMSALPGRPYDGGDPDGFETAVETADRICAWGRHINAPVRVGCAVASARARSGGGFEVLVTDSPGVRSGSGVPGAVRTNGTERITCDALVAATGPAGTPRLPPWAEALPPGLVQVTARGYRRPDQLPEGPVLVVGASSSGVQIADELAATGRPVTLSVGGHVRVPRTYRGADIFCWLDAIGQLDERWDEADDLVRVRRLPSFQLIGTPERRNLDLNALQDAGVALVGKAMALDGHRLLCSGGLPRELAAADLKAARLLARIDEHLASRPQPLRSADSVPSADGAAYGRWGGTNGLGRTNGRDVVEPTGPAHGLEPTRLPASVATELDVRRLTAVVWATGYRPGLGWLDPAAFDHRGEVRHQGGVGDLPGLYLLGLPTLRRRRSTLISGAGPDTADLTAHLHTHLPARAAR